MKKHHLLLLMISSFIQITCQSKSEIKKSEPIRQELYNPIQNYKLDDDEMARRIKNNSIEKEKDSLTLIIKEKKQQKS